MTKDIDPPPDDELRLKEAAEMLGVDATTVRWWVTHDRLPATKRGKTWFVRRRDLMEFDRRRNEDRSRLVQGASQVRTAAASLTTDAARAGDLSHSVPNLLDNVDE